MNLTFSIYIFLDFIKYLVIIDIIFSFLPMIWFNFRPKIIQSITEPLYDLIKNLIPTRVWPLDITGIVIITIIYFLVWLTEILFPGTLWIYQDTKLNIF
jgi:uncharacterized protein YggT (Ycf19 family)